jgi:hypothetical protein
MRDPLADQFLFEWHKMPIWSPANYKRVRGDRED